MKKSSIFRKTLVSGLALAMIVGGSTSALADSKDHDKNEHKNEHKKDSDRDGEFKFEWNNGKDKHEFKLEFKDVGEGFEWAKKHIASLAFNQIFEGYLDGSFRPNKPVSRIEAVATAVRLMGLEEEAKSEEAMDTELSFNDAKHIEKKSGWAVGYLALAIENEIIAESNGNFQPQKPATRIWVATLLVKALGLEDEAIALSNADLDFEDLSYIPTQLRGYVAIAVDKNIVKGYPDDTFRPNKPVTRAELAAFLDRTGDHIPDFNDDAVKGTVSAEVSNGKLLIAYDEGSALLTLDPDAFIYRDGVEISASELEIGDEVLIRSYNGIVIFIEVTQESEEDEEDEKVNTTFTGTLNAEVNSNILSIEKENGTDVEFELADDATIFRSGEEVEASELEEDDVVFVIVQESRIVLVQVISEAEEDEEEVNSTFIGTLNSAVSSNTLSIEIADENDVEFELADDAIFYRAGEEVEASALKAGDEVFINVNNSEITLVHVTKTIEENEFTVEGLFKSFTLNAELELSTITVTQDIYGGTQDSIYNVSPNVTFTGGNGSDLILDQPVELTGYQQWITNIEIK